MTNVETSPKSGKPVWKIALAILGVVYGVAQLADKLLIHPFWQANVGGAYAVGFYVGLGISLLILAASLRYLLKK